jgi:hypothetical protein
MEIPDKGIVFHIHFPNCIGKRPLMLIVLTEVVPEAPPL